MTRVLAVAAVLLLSAACGSDVVTSEPARSTYDGPLVAQGTRFGAAARVVQCQGPVRNGAASGATYDDSEASQSPQDALELYATKLTSDWPRHGYRVAREQATRVLFVYEVDDLVKQAVIVHRGPTVSNTGWYVESWARCDLAEFSEDLTEDSGLHVWSNEAGQRVATATISSYEGPRHCDWQDMTFLVLTRSTYVRNPSPDLADFFAEPYDSAGALPADAVDTGYHRGEQHLWRSPDGTRVYVGSRTGVETWPRTIKPLGCS